jgi:ribosomal protein S18 acetylase RimI-like enzyme
MPQATLLSFFKSRTPGPFASETPQPAPPYSEDESEVSDGSKSTQRQSRTQLSQSVKPLIVSPESRRTPDAVDANVIITNGADLGPPLSGLAIVPVQTDHVLALKRLTGNLLPVRYPDKFFDGTVSEEIPATFSRVALIDGKPVGWIRCRLDPFPEPTVPPSKTKPIYNRIYVQALCILAPYRGLGIATSLLRAITASPLPSKYDIAHVYAHVWESNEEALEWYDKRGFKKIMKVEQYYRKLRPDGAWIVMKYLDGT